MDPPRNGDDSSGPTRNKVVLGWVEILRGIIYGILDVHSTFPLLRLLPVYVEITETTDKVMDMPVCRRLPDYPEKR